MQVETWVSFMEEGKGTNQGVWEANRKCQSSKTIILKLMSFCYIDGNRGPEKGSDS